MMVVMMVAKLNMDTMASKALYPIDVSSEERVALLGGIVQLVQTALETGGMFNRQGVPNFLKSAKGVIGYVQFSECLFICEGDTESQVRLVLDTILAQQNADDEELILILERTLRTRGSEFSSLWG